MKYTSFLKKFFKGTRGSIFAITLTFITSCLSVWGFAVLTHSLYDAIGAIVIGVLITFFATFFYSIINP